MKNRLVQEKTMLVLFCRWKEEYNFCLKRIPFKNYKT